MKCPKCGKELKEGQLYCEECGGEIQIVPDFEPEIESEITETLSGLAEDFVEKKAIEVEEDTNLNQPNIFSAFYIRMRRSKYFSIIVTVFVVFFVGISIFAGINTYQYNSYNYQVSRALNFGDSGEYVAAISYMERALAISSDDKGAELLLADYYYKSGQADDAIYMLKEYIATQKDQTEGYRKLISIYEEKQDYAAINELLLGCEDKEILEQFSVYAAFPPEFGMEAGTYDENVPLKLFASTTGAIYYTLDGTIPTKESDEYTAPIFMDSGVNEVKAIFINSYGLISEVATREFTIQVVIPYPPEVDLYDGTYNTPEKIVVDVPEGSEVYYTTDGSDPTKESSLYKGPINLPLGESYYKFVTYGEEGVAGEITERRYNLQLTNINVDVQYAINLTVLFLKEAGYLMDLEGHAANLNGNYLYTCSTAIKIDNQVFYLVVESYIDENKTQTKTGNQFAVSAMNGLVYKAELNALRNYVIRAF